LADEPLTDEEFRRGASAALALKARREARMTQSAFAETYGIPIGTVRDWEQGRSEPDAAARAYLEIIRAEPATVAVFRAQVKLDAERSIPSRPVPSADTKRDPVGVD